MTVGNPIHATAVAIGGRAVVLRGPPGAGKSDLALRLIMGGAVLVADDQVVLGLGATGVTASPPETIAGLIEVRGVGIRRLSFLRNVPVALVVDLVSADKVDRLPEPATMVLMGVSVPRMALHPFEASAPAKVGIALGLNDTLASPTGIRAPVEYKEGVMSESSTVPKGHVVVITGMSGAGRSTSLKMLEDLGYEAVDNLPLTLLPRLVGQPGSRSRPIAVGVDIRTRDFAASHVVAELDKMIVEGGLHCRLVFLDCDDEVLARRYTETRRRHPLAGDRPVMDGIRLERTRVSSLRARADVVIDTSVLKTADLKRVLIGNFALDESAALKVFVTSFAYRLGLPREADLVFDVRFLDNPYYVPALKTLTGLDPAVGAHIAKDPVFEGFFESLTALLRPLLPRYDGEGKSYLTIAVGCTGGRHRSVYVAERLGQWLSTQGQTVTVAHRDVANPVTAVDDVPLGVSPGVSPGRPIEG